MTAAEIRTEVDAIIEKTFDRLQKVYQNSQKPNADECDSRLIFPKYRNGELRISEQELRCAFEEEFKDSAYAKNKNWHYSVETPTQEIYSFSEDTPRVVTQQNGNRYITDKKRGFKSGNFDFVIHDKDLKRICLIEFKALNPNQSDYHKDFEKLIHDMKDDNNTVMRYFIQVLKSYNKKTTQSIANKLKGINDNDKITEKYKKYFLSTPPKIEYRCYVLEDRKHITADILKAL